MITAAQHQEISKRLAKLNAWVDSIRKRTKCRGCRGRGMSFIATCAADSIECRKCDGKGYVLGWASYKPEDKPANVPDVSNAERSAVEVFEFMRDTPSRYTAYVKVNEEGMGKRPLGSVRTWAGDVLGEITWLGSPYRVAGFGSQQGVRQNMRIKAINGRVYSAVYYKSSGDYCRMKAFNQEVTN